MDNIFENVENFATKFWTAMKPLLEYDNLADRNGSVIVDDPTVCAQITSLIRSIFKTSNQPEHETDATPLLGGSRQQTHNPSPMWNLNNSALLPYAKANQPGIESAVQQPLLSRDPTQDQNIPNPYNRNTRPHETNQRRTQTQPLK